MTPPRSTSRTAARFSILAAFVCMSTNCLSNELVWKHQDSPSGFWSALSQVVNVGTSLLVVAGMVAGVLGIVQGRRQQDPDGALMGVIGLVLNLGILSLAAWVLFALRAAR